MLPRMRISPIFAGSPSVTVKLTLTRLRSIGVTVVVTSAPYRLRVRYWRLSSCSARSARALSKGLPSPMPTSFNDLLSASVSNSFKPMKLTLAMIGRSSMITTAEAPSILMRTSLNKPVANKARNAAAPLSSL